jgi:hypothetical protein
MGLVARSGGAAPILERALAKTATSARAALAAGVLCLVLVAGAAAVAWPASSPLVPEHRAADGGWAWVYLALAAAAFAAYLVGVLVLERLAVRTRAVVLLACAVQIVPLAAPVLLSTDAYAYWDYGRIAAVHGANPYEETPLDFPEDPAFPFVGADLRDETSVYGPGFTLVSEAHAAVVGESADVAAWLYKALAAAAMVVLALVAARLGRRPAFAAAFVGWNPLLALHFAGGGHNDAWMAALVLAALALGASRRRSFAGAAWAAGIAVKWVPLLFLPLRLLEARRTRRPVDHVGFAVAAAVVGAVAFWRYGWSWLGAFGPLGQNVVEERASVSIPSRIAALGVPADAAVALFAVLFGLAYLWLLREAWRGRARLALTAVLLLLATSFLRPWYAVWALPLAAVEEDRLARWLALALSAYLLPEAVPL